MTATAVDESMARSAVAEHPDVTSTVGPETEKARIVVGYGAAVAPLPYLLVKVIWVCGNLFAAAFVRYARHRWRVAFRGRSGEMFPGATHPVQAFLAAPWGSY